MSFHMGANNQPVPLLLKLVVAPWVTTVAVLCMLSSAAIWDGSHRIHAVS